jgi:hypothetical protein
MTRLWILPVLGLIAALSIACSDEGEGAPSETRPPSAVVTSPSPTATHSRSPTPSPAVTRAPESDAGIPAGWKTYTSDDGRLSLRYPPDLFENGGVLSTWEPPVSGGIDGIPPNSWKVDVGVNEGASNISGCGPIAISNGVISPLPGSVPAALGGVPAWELVEEDLTGPLTMNLTLVDSISAVVDDTCITMTALFRQDQPDVETFQLMVRTLEYRPNACAGTSSGARLTVFRRLC